MASKFIKILFCILFTGCVINRKTLINHRLEFESINNIVYDSITKSFLAYSDNLKLVYFGRTLSAGEENNDFFYIRYSYADVIFLKELEDSIRIVFKKKNIDDHIFVLYYKSGDTDKKYIFPDSTNGIATIHIAENMIVAIGYNFIYYKLPVCKNGTLSGCQIEYDWAEIEKRFSMCPSSISGFNKRILKCEE